MRLSKLTYKDYFELSPEAKQNIELVFQYYIIHSKNIFDLPFITKWTFENVRCLIANYNQWNDFQFMEYFSKLANIPLEKFAQYPLIEILNFKKHIENEIEVIRELENELNYSPNGKEKTAGIDEFNIFGDYISYRELANNDVTKIESIKNLEYSLCYTELLMRKKIIEFNRNIEKLNK